MQLKLEDDLRGYQRVIVGWSPDSAEREFAISPTRFCYQSPLNPAQCGVVRYLSRYQYEKNPWLLKQAGLLTQLILEFGQPHHLCPWIRPLLGQQIYLAPRLNPLKTGQLNIATYCLINRIDNRLLLPMSLICEQPHREGLEEAVKLIERLTKGAV